MAEQTQNVTSSQQNNSYYHAARVIEMRLDTTKLLDNCRLFLSGREEKVIKLPDGTITTEYQQIGEPRLNEKGVAALMQDLNLIFNPSVVQGNYGMDRYLHEIKTIRISLAKKLMLNLYKWEISSREYEGIIDGIMVSVKAYLSRLIDDKERESYKDTLKVVENNTLREKGRFSA